MKKMLSPELEIIRFDSQDIIVTSGGGTTVSYFNLIPGQYYFARSDELMQYNSSKYKTLDEDRFNVIYISTWDSSFHTQYTNVCSAKKLNDNEVIVDQYYAWFNGEWFTENQTKGFYLANVFRTD